MRVVGIDINSSGVRVVRLDKNFRDLVVAGVAEKSFARHTGPDVGELNRTLQALKQEGALDGELWVASLPGDQGYIRILEVPPTDAEKTNLLVRNQLDGLTPQDIDETTVVSSMTLSTEKGKPSRVLACVANGEQVSSVLSRFTPVGLDPQLVTHEAAALGLLAPKLSLSGSIALLDIGPDSSTLIITSNGSPCAFRAIKRGRNLVVNRLARAAELPPEELLKHIGTAEHPQPMLQEVAQPFAAEIRRTILGLRAKGDPAPDALIVTGEGALIRGFDQAIANLSGLNRLSFDLTPLKFKTQVQKRGAVIGLSPLFSQNNERFCRALSLAMMGTDRPKALTLRQGALAFRGDFSQMAGQFAKIAAVLLLLLALGGLAAYGKYSLLRAEEKAAVAKLSSAFKEVSGKELNDLDSLDAALNNSGKGGAKHPWPETTGFDILLAISQKIPNDITVDINKINIQPKKTTLQGEIDNAGDVDRIQTALKDFPCFKEMKTGSVKQITNREGKQRHDFTLDIETTCP